MFLPVNSRATPGPFSPVFFEFPMTKKQVPTTRAPKSSPVIRKGWHFPANASVGHYFLQGESLCGNYILTPGVKCLDTDVILPGLDCSFCARVLPEIRLGATILEVNRTFAHLSKEGSQ